MYLVFVFGVDAFFYVGITEDVRLQQEPYGIIPDENGSKYVVYTYSYYHYHSSNGITRQKCYELCVACKLLKFGILQRHNAYVCI